MDIIQFETLKGNKKTKNVAHVNALLDVAYEMFNKMLGLCEFLEATSIHFLSDEIHDLLAVIFDMLGSELNEVSQALACAYFEDEMTKEELIKSIKSAAF